MYYISSVHVEGFKSWIKPTTIPFRPGLNCIIGANGSGKSVLLGNIVYKPMPLKMYVVPMYRCIVCIYVYTCKLYKARKTKLTLWKNVNEMLFVLFIWCRIHLVRLGRGLYLNFKATIHLFRWIDLFQNWEQRRDKSGKKEQCYRRNGIVR